ATSTSSINHPFRNCPTPGLEAINNKIKTTIKIGYGYRNLDNLISLVMLKCGGLDLQLPGRQ
ncbi:transposase, partial [Bifidobacterium reuteri]|uniref:transposase n=1 Tax=Bifidobacterium reuteri TaxID=983706 RepID=UPI0005C75302